MFNGESLTGIQWRLINVWIWQSPEGQVSWCQEMAATKVRRSSELLANTVRMNIHWFPTPDLAPLGSVSQPPCGHRTAGQPVLWYRPVWCSAPVYQSCFTPQQVNTANTSIKTSTTTLNNFTNTNNVNILYIHYIDITDVFCFGKPEHLRLNIFTYTFVYFKFRCVVI